MANGDLLEPGCGAVRTPIMRFHGLSAVIAVSLALFAGPAHAHINLLSPMPRTMSLKSGPCGAGPNDPRGPTVATFKPGEKIMVTFNEFVDHPGHFRVAFDADGQDIFVDPKSFDDVGGGPGVLIDGIADKQGGDYMVEVMLPNIECDNCVLQVIQVMTDKPPYGDGNDMYYQCADIALEAEVASTTSGEPGSTGGPETTTEPGTTAPDPSTTAPDPSAGETAGGTAGEASTGTPDPSAGETAGASDPQTSDSPTSDGAGGSTGGGSSGTGTAGDGVDSEGHDGECGCRGDNQGGWLALGLLPLLMPRRRPTARRSRG